MRKFRVNVNGTSYDVAVEELSGSQASAPAPAAAAPAPAAPVAKGGGESVAAPMPGTILGVNVNVGDAVKSGQVIMILEAMKMENEIMAPCDGKVKSVVTKGAAVTTGDVLAVIG